MQLAKREAMVIMGVRDLDRGKVALQEIKEKYPNSTVVLMRIDLGDVQSIKNFVKEFESTYPHLNILVNNAGVMDTTRKQVLTTDGFEINVGVNHLGTFLLTKLLLDALSRGAPSRVVTIASTNLSLATLDLDDLMMEKRVKSGDGYREQYNISKLCIATSTRKLAASLDPQMGIKVFLMCPGYVKTDMFRHDQGCSRKCKTKFTLCFGGISPHKGSETICFLCLSKSVVADENSGRGEMYRFCKLWKKGNHILTKMDGSEDVARLYKITEDLLGLGKDAKEISEGKAALDEDAVATTE